MSDKPKRLWFQFHLSTAVLLSIVAGALMWANYPVADNGEPDEDYADYEGIHHRLSSKRTGWPFTYIQLHLDGHRLTEIRSAVFPLMNLAFATVVLAAVAYFSEHRIRRREARKT